MATAVLPSPEPKPKATNPTARLLAASVLGAVYLLACAVFVGYGVPLLLQQISLGNSFIAAFVRVVAQIAAIAGLVYVGSWLAGDNPPKGLRGGIFLVISVVITWFFLVRAVGLNLDGLGGQIGLGVTAAVALGLLFAAYKFLTSPRAIGWMHALEEMGWFHTNSYKRTQGLRLRRYTMIGLLLVGLSGVWTMLTHRTLGTEHLTLTLPFGLPSLVVLSDKQYAVPLILAGLTLWVAWRAVNMPTFADFLVATEAEMNKVSWESRRKLIQDTIVVLTTTAMLTGFLLVVDLFWGWLLSNRYVGVLPVAQPKERQVVQEQRDW